MWRIMQKTQSGRSGLSMSNIRRGAGTHKTEPFDDDRDSKIGHFFSHINKIWTGKCALPVTFSLISNIPTSSLSDRELMRQSPGCI